MNLIYKNTNATRNQKITDHLFSEIAHAIYLVYGPKHIAHIYSGGQPRRGTAGKRTGTIRHDNFGKGGRAADIYVYDGDNVKVTGEGLAPLAQYWAASKNGGVGVEMRVGGIHLDEWAKPPQRGGMFWYYDYGKGTKARKVQQHAIAQGLKGIMPPLYKPKPQSPWAALFRAIAAIFKGLKR
jgi:hypothetical protein